MLVTCCTNHMREDNPPEGVNGAWWGGRMKHLAPNHLDENTRPRTHKNKVFHQRTHLLQRPWSSLMQNPQWKQSSSPNELKKKQCLAMECRVVLGLSPKLTSKKMASQNNCAEQQQAIRQKTAIHRVWASIHQLHVKHVKHQCSIWIKNC